MLRVLTITLNPALDQVYEVPAFALGAINRPTSKSTTAGGKGLNVAREFRALGGEAFATGFVGGRVGRDIVAAAEADGIPSAFVNIISESRVNIKIADSVSGSQTELNENGPTVTGDEYAALVSQIRELLPGFDVVVLSGSVPPGVPVGVYAELIRIAQDEFGVMALLDASGDALRQGIAAKPSIVKPNRDEAADLGIAPDPWEQAPAELRAKFGVPVAIVTAGADGAVIESDAGRWLAVPPSIAVKSAVGSGDSLTAGFLSGWHTQDAAMSLRLGVAAGAVNATSYRSGDISAATVREMTERVAATRI